MEQGTERRTGRTPRRVAAGTLAAACVGMGVAAPAQAAGSYDLVVTTVRPVLTGVQATGSQVVFLATIRNAGTVATPAGVVHGVAFAVNGRNVAWEDDSRESLPVGGERSVLATGGPTGSASWTAVTGSYTLTATVDDVNRMPGEVDEQNNTRSTTFSVAPVKPVTGIVARPSTPPLPPNHLTQPLTQAQFEATHAKTLDVSWQIPAGQPVGVTYAVTEQPYPVTCQNSQPVFKGSTSTSSTSFDMTGGAQCGNSAEVYSDRYTVTAIGPTGSGQVSTAGQQTCTWSNSVDRTQHGQQLTTFGCEGGTQLVDFDDPVFAAVDAGAAAPSYGWEGDNGFDEGQTYTEAFPGLTPAQASTRWGWSWYSLPIKASASPGGWHARMTFVEPTFTARGQRVFDVSVNGELVADDLDIYAKVGRGKPYVLDVPIANPTDVVTVTAQASRDNPIVSTIEVRAH